MTSSCAQKRIQRVELDYTTFFKSFHEINHLNSHTCIIIHVILTSEHSASPWNNTQFIDPTLLSLFTRWNSNCNDVQNNQLSGKYNMQNEPDNQVKSDQGIKVISYHCISHYRYR